MGFFNSYTKEGKGVDKDETKPIRPLYFFELFFRKFSKMITLNMLYILLTCPIWIALGIIMLTLNSASLEEFGVFQQLQMFSYVFMLFSVLTGPATAGITYMFKSYATEMPTFTMADFFEHYKKNFKQSTLLMIINGLYLLSFSLTLQLPQLRMMVIPSIIFLVLLIFINFYAFSIMTMFKMKFIDILKNSLIFALAKLPFNVLYLAIIGGLSYALLIYPVIGAILLFLIFYSFSGFLVVFSVYPTIEKYMLDPVHGEEEEAE